MERSISMKNFLFCRKRQIAACVAVVSFFFVGVIVEAQKKATSSATVAIFVPDKGKFTIQLNGQTVGHEDFEIAPSGGGWLAKGISDIKPPEGAASKITGALTLQSNGEPVSYQWSAQSGKTNGAHVLFANGVAKITLEMEGARPCTTEEIKDPNRTQPCFFEQNLSFDTPLIAVLDNNLYHQYAVLARMYDWAKRGAQSFPVLIPQELTPGSINVEATGPAAANGKTYEGLRVATPDLEVLLYLDNTHRLMRLEVPTAKVAVVRD
jgi:hypothetical protein